MVEAEFGLADELNRLLESQVGVALHPLLNHVVLSRRLAPCLERAAGRGRPQDRWHLCRLLGLLLTPSYQSTLSHLVPPHQILDLFLTNLDHGSTIAFSSFLFFLSRISLSDDFNVGITSSPCIT